MTEGYCQRRGSQRVIPLPRSARYPGQDTRAYLAEIDGQHVAHVAIGNQVSQRQENGSDARLETDHRQNAILSCQVRHLLGFLEIGSQRPLSIDVLARPQDIHR